MKNRALCSFFVEAGIETIMIDQDVVEKIILTEVNRQMTKCVSYVVKHSKAEETLHICLLDDLSEYPFTTKILLERL